jgi:ankyrin repeat protein
MAATHRRGPSPLDPELVEAAFVCDLGRVRDLLARGANPDARDDEGRTPLFSAVLGGSLALLGLLLEEGADVGARDEHDWTALHVAAEEVVPEMASLLCARGADVNARDDEGNTPLARAVFSARGNDAVMRILLKHGAKDDVPNKSGETPREKAERLGQPWPAAPAPSGGQREN